MFSNVHQSIQSDRIASKLNFKILGKTGSSCLSNFNSLIQAIYWVVNAVKLSKKLILSILLTACRFVARN